MKMKTCAREDCSNTFTPKTHNQKYCTDDCCRIATNATIMKRYYKNKARKNGALRHCAEGCGTPLSRYNETEICQSCTSKRAQAGKSDILRRLGFDNY